MEKLTNLEDLFHHQLKDIYSAETQIVKALPDMIENANNKKLKKAFSDHLEETKITYKDWKKLANSSMKKSVERHVKL